MFATRRDVVLFLGKTLLALPLALALWYACTPFLNAMAVALAKAPIAIASGARVSAPVLHDGVARYGVTVFPEYQMGRSRPPLETDVKVKPSIYTFGIALFLALSAAHRRTRRFWPIAIGVAVLLVTPVWGVAFDVLKQLTFSPQVAPYLRVSELGQNAVALGYQVGSLLLPTLVPIALWCGFNWPAISERTA